VTSFSVNDGSRGLLSFGGKIDVLGGDFRKFFQLLKREAEQRQWIFRLSGRRYGRMQVC
jgi:hypothetical protein